MPRLPRIEYPGALYLLVSRGNRGQAVFLDDTDRHQFSKTLGEACRKAEWVVHGFVLMPDHFHLVVETPATNLSEGMKWLLSTYTAWFNRRHRFKGHLFAGRYRSLLVSNAADFLARAVDYVHLNPARARLIRSKQRLRSYAWSSFPHFLEPPGTRPLWLETDRVLRQRGMQGARAKDAFESYTERLRTTAEPEYFGRIRRGWWFGEGEPDGRRGLAEEQSGVGLPAAEAAPTTVDKAERVVGEELQRLGWRPEVLESRAKGDLGKIEIAERLRAETTRTLRWIADRLRMGTPEHLAHLLYWRRRGTKPPRPAKTSRRPRAKPRRTARREQSLPPKAIVPEPEAAADSTFFDLSFD